MACQLVVDIAAPVLSNQMLRRIVPTAERTVTRAGDKKIIDGRDAIRERLPRWQGFSEVSAQRRLVRPCVRPVMRPFRVPLAIMPFARLGSRSIART